MARRMLWDSICVSDTINGLSCRAENTFYRLLVTVDDFGRADARLPILKAKMYPLDDEMTPETLGGYMAELYSSGLIMAYEVDGRQYLQVKSWDEHQAIRTRRAKYPAPPAQDCDDAEQVCNNHAQTCNRSVQVCTDVQQDAVQNSSTNSSTNSSLKLNDESEAHACADPDHHSPAPSGLGDTYTDDELLEEQDVQQTAEMYVRQYGLTYNSRTLDAITSDIRTHGKEVVKDALDRASDSDRRGGISLKYYRACLANTGGKAGDKSCSGYARHSDDEWTRAATAAIIDLDTE